MYKTGDRIRHERHGAGTVTDVTTVDGFQRGWIEWDDADSDAYRGTWAIDSATFRPEPTRAEALAAAARWGGTPTGCTLGDACDGCPQHDR